MQKSAYFTLQTKPKAKSLGFCSFHYCCFGFNHPVNSRHATTATSSSSSAVILPLSVVYFLHKYDTKYCAPIAQKIVLDQRIAHDTLHLVCCARYSSKCAHGVVCYMECIRRGAGRAETVPYRSSRNTLVNDMRVWCTA